MSGGSGGIGGGDVTHQPPRGTDGVGAMTRPRTQNVATEGDGVICRLSGIDCTARNM